MINSASKPVTIQQAIDDVCRKQPFMSAMVHALQPVEAEYVPTMGTDGEFLYWNPEFLKTLSRSQAAAVVYHEVLHCLFRHMWRRGKREQMKFNIACDFAINPTVSESFPLPNGALIERKYFDLDAETIYDRLPKPKPQQGNGKKKKGKGSGEGQQSQSQGGGSGQEQQDQQSGSGEGKDKKGKGEKDRQGSSGGNGKQKDKKQDKNQDGQGSGSDDLKEQEWGDHTMWGAEGKKKRKEIEKNRSMLDKARGKNKVPQSTMTEAEKEKKWERLYESEVVENYGHLPSMMKRTVEKTHFIPVIDWATLVQNLLSADESDYNFSRPDRRFLDNDFVIPGLYSQERLQDVIFAYDTSGSISQEDLRDFYNETKNLFDNFSNIQGYIAVCDADLHDFFEVNIEKEFEELEFRGGGGTDFRPVFREIEKRNLNPKAVFYFTDTYGSFPEPTDYPVFWMVKSKIQSKSFRSHLRVPFGQLIEFMPRGKGGK